MLHGQLREATGQVCIPNSGRTVRLMMAEGLIGGLNLRKGNVDVEILYEGGCGLASRGAMSALRRGAAQPVTAVLAYVPGTMW